MFSNGFSLFIKKLGHLLLRKPHGFILHLHFYLGLAVFSIVDDDLIAFVLILHGTFIIPE